MSDTEEKNNTPNQEDLSKVGAVSSFFKKHKSLPALILVLLFISFSFLWIQDEDNADILLYLDRLMPAQSNQPSKIQAEPKKQPSTLVLDLEGLGIHLVALNETGSVYWDINENGFANASGWIGEGTGLLAIDLNGDGIINNHSELFGSLTEDGFSALAQYDLNQDGIIDEQDAVWDQLLVWVDKNSDGYSQADELYSMNDLGITSINLNYTLVNYEIAGNPITHESTFTMNGKTRSIVDAWFAYDLVNTVYNQDYVLDYRIFSLPTLRGSGQLPDLHIAMSLDETLLKMVSDLNNMSLQELSAQYFLRQSLIHNIMYQWAGVSDIDPCRRGSHVDARELEFLESVRGKEFRQRGSNPNPTAKAAPFIQEGWNNAYKAFSSRLLYQLPSFSDFFIGKPAYSLARDIPIQNLKINYEYLTQFFADENHDLSHKQGIALFMANLIKAVIASDDDQGHHPLWQSFQETLPPYILLEDLRDRSYANVCSFDSNLIVLEEK